jgi:uncharacterized protein (TIGR02996 family)
VRPDALARDFLAAIEADPANPEPKLLMADWLEENDVYPEMQYALRWMAARGRHPKRETDTWYWLYETDDAETNARKPHLVPRRFHRAYDGVYRTMNEAFESLAEDLGYFRKALEIPA